MGKRTRLVKLIGGVVTAVVLLGLLYALAVNRPDSSGVSPVPVSTAPSQASTDAQLADLFAAQASNVQVAGVGTVSRLLADDLDGAKHQRFILRLDSGQTLLVAHNIDIAPRLDGLAVGDTVEFFGEYVYTAQGGTIHWTHHDPSGKHVAGWLQWRGLRYS